MRSRSIRRIDTHPSDSNDIPYRQVREYLVHECIVGETKEMMIRSEECGHHCMKRAVSQNLPYESMATRPYGLIWVLVLLRVCPLTRDAIATLVLVVFNSNREGSPGIVVVVSRKVHPTYRLPCRGAGEMNPVMSF